MPTKVSGPALNAPTPEISPHCLYRDVHAASFGGMSCALFRRLVAEGKAPAPAVRSGRFTRWRASDIRDWLIALADGSAAISDKGAEVSK